MYGLGLTRTKGRAAKDCPIVAVRELTLDDKTLAETTEKGIRPPPLRRISERHHALARLIASGMRNDAAAIQLGFAPATVSILKGDPAFEELVQFYRDNINQQFGDHHEMLAGLSMDAIIALRERIETEPEEMETGTLMKIAELSLDRAGYGPSSKQEVNVNIGLAERLESARKRVLERRDSMRTIDLKAEATE